LFVFNQFGDLERCALRPGNVHSADAWDAVLKPVVTRYQGKVSRIYFRADAGFANREVYEFLEAERVFRIWASRQFQKIATIYASIQFALEYNALQESVIWGIPN
jgi:hypothetical protein